jgi:hypothetical protein
MTEQPSTTKYAFVLMQFADEFLDVYELGIKAACREVGIRCERVDEQIFQENILNRVYAEIRRCDLIISEMTGRNPNVFYETGYAHAIGKRVILLTQEATDIPFDLKQYQHIVYGKSIVVLKGRLKTVLSAVVPTGCESAAPAQAEPPSDLSRIHDLLRALQDQIASVRPGTTQPKQDLKSETSLHAELWRAIIEVHNRAKAIYLLAEEFDPNFQGFIQPVFELRHALEHIIRGKASELGMEGVGRDADYQRASLEKALGHMYRAYFDGADWFSVSMRERIIKTLSPYSREMIVTVLPSYYMEMRPRIDAICQSVVQMRATKDIALAPWEAVTAYDAALRELSEIYESLSSAIPALAEMKRRRRFRIFR